MAIPYRKERKDQITLIKGAKMLKKLKDIIGSLVSANIALTRVMQIHQLLVQDKVEHLRQNSRYQNPKSLIPFGYKIYSQSDEDGIIREIFRRIGLTTKTFVEFGIGDGLENNTLSLLFDGWQGLWIDASTESINRIKAHLSSIINIGQLKVVDSFITKRNINDLICHNINHKEIDLLSIDIDGNDYHVFDEITCVNPRVVVIEYNAKFTPPTIFCIEYDESHVFKSDDYFGASLKFLELRFQSKGYCLVGCNLLGSNAFFVRNDLLENKFLEPFTAENHYEPARQYLGGFASGKRPSYKTLERSIKMNVGGATSP